MALNSVIEKVKQLRKISYKLLKEEDGYNLLIDIYSYPTLVQLKYFLGRTHHCVSVVDKWVFDSDFTFTPYLTQENLDYCCSNDNEKMNK